ncbi:putative chaperone protein EcpD [Enterobacter cloacae]|uniref:Putative chaperone protein EcpD n=1 Tax=Enterobacter cloacae TaxID=550 RepID=A0A377M7C6_ENTCL|nr:putative chaperone protein EcpD [Enterobacter cloacae]
MYVLNIKSGLKALLLASMSVFALNASADIVISAPVSFILNRQKT